MHVLWCFKTTTTASLILLAEPGSCSSCVCSSRCKLQKVIPAGCLKTAGSCDFHSRQHISLPLRLTHCLFLGIAHAHTHKLCMFSVHTHAVFAFTIINIFSVWLSLLPSPLCLICMCVLVCLDRVMTCVTGVGSYRGRQSHGRDTSLCASNNLFVVRPEHTHTHTPKSTMNSCSFVKRL